MWSRYFIGLFLIFTGVFAKAQSYGPEWIIPGQPYYRIPVGEDGIYRISYQTMLQAGIPVTTVDPRFIQLWSYGTEQYIYVHGEADQKLDTSDYIEFVGWKNRGDLDRAIYRSPGEQPHQFYSLFTDTNAYFLTWTSNTPGKRMTDFQETNYADYTPEPYYLHEELTVYTEMYHDGEPLGDKAQLCEYTNGEGWMGNLFTAGAVQNRPVTVSSYVSSGPDAQYRFGVFGKSDAESLNPDYNHHLQVLSPAGQVLMDRMGQGYYRVDTLLVLPPGTLSNGNNIFKFRSANDLGASADAHAVSYTLLRYPRSYTLANKANWFLPYKGFISASRGLIQANGYPVNHNAPLIFDTLYHLRITATVNNGTIQALIPYQGISRTLVLWDPALAKEAVLQPTSSRSISLQRPGFVIVTHPRLLNAAQEYNRFNRQRGYDTLLVTMPELYTLFSYGMEHPIALHNFCRWLNDSALVKPEYILLLGKGQTNDRTWNNAVNKQQNLVPGIGYPPSDYLFVSGFNGKRIEPGISIGRIPAISNEQVFIYLDKLKTYLSENPSLSRKALTHLAAGDDDDENTQFSSFLNQMGAWALNTPAGAQIATYSLTDIKQDAGTTQRIVSRLKQGNNMMTYIGHAATSVLNIDLGQPSDIPITPAFYFGGCLLGNVCSDYSLAESYLFAPGKGPLVWMSNSSYSFTNGIRDFGNEFYRQAFREHYGSSLGHLLKYALRAYGDTADAYNLIQSRSFLLIGDPSVPLYQPLLSDPSITGASLAKEGLTTANDSLPIALVFTNTGCVLPADSMEIRVVRTLSDNSNRAYYLRLHQALYYRDTVIITLPSLGSSGKGQNRLDIFLDPGNRIPEVQPNGEANNMLQTTFYLPDDGISLLSPPYHGIVGTDSAVLTVQANNLMGTGNQFYIELDTSAYFSSPWKKTVPALNANALVKWKAPLIVTADTITYYWRARIAQGTPSWSTSVFTRIPFITNGWTQANFRELYYEQGAGSDLQADTNSQTVDFTYTTTYPYLVQTSGSAVSNAFTRIMRVKGYATRYQGAITNGLAVLALDPETGLRFSQPSRYNQKHNTTFVPPFDTQDSLYYKQGGYSGTYFFNTTLAADRDSFKLFIRQLPQGYRVLLHSGANTGIASWDTGMFTVFGAIGAAYVDALKEGYPYLLVGQKGMQPGQATEQLADTVNSTVPPKQQVLTYNTSFTMRKTSGKLVSEPIGPVRLWRQAHYKLGPNDAADSVTLDVLGIDTLNEEHILRSGLAPSTLINLSAISAAQYPYLRLRLNTTDPVNRTPAMLKSWQVTSVPLPEGTLQPDIAYQFHSDTLQEGDSLRMSIAFQNISPTVMDSLDYRFIINPGSAEKIFTGKTATLNPDSVAVLRTAISTKGLAGKNEIALSVNPGGIKPEQTLLNNYIRRSFFVTTDMTNPVFDITVDGKHLLNGDIVSPSPEIRLRLSDNNDFLPVSDTALITLMLKYPGQSNPTRISFSQSDVQYQYDPVKKHMEMVYHPENLPGGEYILIAGVKDASGNPSGKTDYQSAFQVIRESTITNFYPYPNPFTSQCRFVFTLTGEQLPDQLLIRIMTVSGKIIREVTLAELGPVRIGHNISEFAWNGTDQFGDPVGNGVYLYQVIARSKGNDIRHRQTSADHTVQNGWGKLYIMR